MGSKAQETHIHFGSLSDMLHAVSPKLIACKVQIHQCPDGGTDGAGVSNRTTGMCGALFDLLALGKSSCDMLGALSLELVVADVQ